MIANTELDEIVDMFSVHRPRGRAKGTLARREMKNKLRKAFQKQLNEERLDAQIKVVSSVLVWQATGKKRIGLSRSGVVAVLASLQAKRDELLQTKGV
jgi:hypothetical protein